MLQYRGDAETDSPALHFQWTDWASISPNVALAAVAAEDQRFADHMGFDVDAIRSAMAENKSRGLPRGASTISQQVAKNLYLWPGRSLARKGIEAYFTVLIELFWPKQRILEVYLNIAQFGPGVFGVGAASEQYFAKPPSRIRRREAALLAAVLPNPHVLHVDRPSRYVRGRGRDIERQMSLLGGTSYIERI